MKKIHQLVLILVLTTLTAACDKGGNLSEFYDVNTEQTFNVTKIKTPWIVLNYWAEWCAPCREEIPELNELTADENLTIIGVYHTIIDNETLKKLSQEFNIQYTSTSGDIANALNINRQMFVPITYLIHRESAKVITLKGPQTKQTIKGAMEEAISEFTDSVARVH